MGCKATGGQPRGPFQVRNSPTTFLLVLTSALALREREMSVSAGARSAAAS